MSATPHDLTSIRGIVFDLDGVLSPAAVPLDRQGRPVRMADVKDTYAIRLALQCGIHIAVITGAVDPAINRRFARIGLTDIYTGAADKLVALRSWLDLHHLSTDDIAFVGDDIPDLPPMRLAALSVAPADAAADVRREARYITRAAGGHGVARELIEQILRAKGLWMTSDHAFRW